MKDQQVLSTYIVLSFIILSIIFWYIRPTIYWKLKGLISWLKHKLWVFAFSISSSLEKGTHKLHMWSKDLIDILLRSIPSQEDSDKSPELENPGKEDD